MVDGAPTESLPGEVQARRVWRRAKERFRQCLVLAVVATLVARVVVLGEGVDHGPSALLLEVERVVALGDADVAHLAPELAPRVADDPVLGAALGAPADDRDDVVDAVAGHGDDAASVVEDRAGVNAARDRAALVDLLGHGVGALDRAELGYGDVRVLGEADALALRREGRAGPGGVHVVGRAVPLGGRAEALRGLRRAGHVRVRGLVRDAGAGGLRDLVDPLVRPVDR